MLLLYRCILCTSISILRAESVGASEEEKKTVQ